MRCLSTTFPTQTSVYQRWNPVYKEADIPVEAAMLAREFIRVFEISDSLEMPISFFLCYREHRGDEAALGLRVACTNVLERFLTPAEMRCLIEARVFLKDVNRQTKYYTAKAACMWMNLNTGKSHLIVNAWIWL